MRRRVIRSHGQNPFERQSRNCRTSRSKRRKPEDIVEFGLAGAREFGAGEPVERLACAPIDQECTRGIQFRIRAGQRACQRADQNQKQ
jgi:hypothetical protein